MRQGPRRRGGSPPGADGGMPARPGSSAALLLGCLQLLLLLHHGQATMRRSLTATPTPGGPRWAQPNYTIYHHQDDLLAEVHSIVLANPGFMKIEVLAAKDGDYAAELKVVTIEPGGFTSRQRAKAKLLVDFGEHGREYISSELGLLLMRTLADPSKLMNVFGNDEQRGQRLAQLLQGTVFKILPMENEGGRKLVEAGKLCERKNGRGVDPNRNWPLDWGKKEKDYDPNEEFPGRAPFSEPEVQLLHNLAAEFGPHVWLNVHSGMEAMFTPWDHKAEVPPGAKEALTILQTINKDLMGGTSCVVGSGGKSVGYLAHGTATDYMFEVLHVPMPYTWEIYGDFDADFHDCFRMFNPIGEAAVQGVLVRWLKAIFRLVELMPSHPALAASKAWSTPDADPKPKPAAAVFEDTRKDDAAAPDVVIIGGGTAGGEAAARKQQQQQGGEGANATGGSGATATVPSSSAAPPLPANESELRPAVVASRLGFGSRWPAWYLQVSIALSGLVLAGVLISRYLNAGGPVTRGGGAMRGGNGDWRL